MLDDPLSTQEEAQVWRERYRVLFGENVAGVILTTPAGRIVDCNEACARILGFDSKETLLARSDAWDFYFKRADREILIDRLRTQGNSSAEEVCLRARDGAPIWVIARRTVASYVDGVPELIQGTFIDITAQRKAQERMRDTINDLSQRIGNILQRVNNTRPPDSLPQIDSAEMQQCFVALDQMNMLMSELAASR